MPRRALGRRRSRSPASARPLVLDTHVWIRAVEGHADRLSGPVVREIERAAMANRLHVSAISAWEIAMLVRKGRITLSRDASSWIAAARRPPGVRITPVTSAIALDST